MQVSLSYFFRGILRPRIRFTSSHKVPWQSWLVIQSSRVDSRWKSNDIGWVINGTYQAQRETTSTRYAFSDRRDSHPNPRLRADERSRYSLDLQTPNPHGGTQNDTIQGFEHWAEPPHSPWCSTDGGRRGCESHDKAILST